LSTLRFSYASVSIEGISRICSHQIVRIAHAGILQESQRYVKLSNIEYVTPDSVSLLNPRLQERWIKHLAEGSEIYNDCIKDGQKKEDARYILSHSCTTKVNLCLNFQGWRDVIKNRTNKTAQWEIRDVFEEIERLLHEVAPNIF
jgi:thymidylate synthase (FAD)